MSEDAGEKPFGVCARTREFVGMADASGFNFNQNLALLRAFEVYFHNFKRFAGL